MATHASDPGRARAGWRPSAAGVLLIAAADFCGAVGLANLFLDQPAAVWLLIAAALLAGGISTGG